jgi:hypothetical protein
MKKLILAGVLVALGLGPALASAQTGGTTGGGTTDNDTSGTTGGSMKGSGGSTPPDQSGSGNSGVNSSTESSGTAPQPARSTKPTNKVDCERAGGKWKSVLHRCDLDG